MMHPGSTAPPSNHIINRVIASSVRRLRLDKKWVLMLFVAAVVARGAHAAQPPPVPISVAHSGNTVSAAGLTPNGKAVLFGVAWRPRGDWVDIIHRDLVLDADAAGSVQRELPEGVATSSVWCVVDLATGRNAVMTPEGSQFRRIEFLDRGLKAEAPGQFKKLEAGNAMLEVLCVRPGVGAWVWQSSDGGPADGDHLTDGRVTVLPESMRALGDSPAAPKHFLPGDTLVLIDPHRKEIYATEVKR